MSQEFPPVEIPSVGNLVAVTRGLGPRLLGASAAEVAGAPRPLPESRGICTGQALSLYKVTLRLACLRECGVIGGSRSPSVICDTSVASSCREIRAPGARARSSADGEERLRIPSPGQGV